jgi:hypothetical protein
MKTVQTPRPTNERFILREYAHEGLKPHYASDGTLVSLWLARQIGVKLEPAE